MTYQYLMARTYGKPMPLAGKNIDGENVIIEHRTEKWSYGEESWERNYFQVTTAQHNGWTRINLLFEDGSHEELYQKSA